MKNSINSTLKLLRIKHYIKNLLIFFPLFFDKSFFEWNLFENTCWAFLAFSFVTSVVYIINDYKDIEKDKLHPTKKFRPLASGDISKKAAILLSMILLVLVVIIFSVFIQSNIKSIIIILIYFLINVLYSFGLKEVPLLDIVVLSSGFLLRVIFGANINSIQLSYWLFLTVLSMALFLSLGKRRNELVKIGTNGRNVLKYYTTEFCDKNMYVCLALTIVFYSLWAVNITKSSNESSNMVYTVPLVIIICMKYSMNIEANSDGDPTEVLFKDKLLIILLILWSLLVFAFVYYV